MKMIAHFGLMALLTLSACSTPHTLSTEAMNVKVAKNKPKTCAVVGKFQGKHDEGSVELARNQALNLAAEKGATDIYFDEEINNGKKWVVHAIGYMCR